MKKVLLAVAKCVAFILLWACAISLLIPNLSLDNPALENLWYEAMPLVYTVLVTLGFVYIVERRRIRVPLWQGFGRNLLLGAIVGVVWLGVSLGILFAGGIARFEGYNAVPYIAVWVLASLLNVIMQELLVRGYLYQLLRTDFNVPVALVGTTAFFALMHGGAFGAGWVAIANVLTMSIFVTLLMEYSGSLIAPILAHFIWNTVGGLCYGAVSLGFAYPTLMNVTFSGNALLSGGMYKLEGSLVVLVVNLLLIASLAFMLRRQARAKAG